MATGTSDSELIYGSHNDDELFALAGDDTIYAGRGSDWVYGGDGNDTIYGDRTPVIYGDDSLTAVEDYAGSVTFVSENTNSRSALGVYKIAADGSIYDVDIVFSNASANGQQQDLIAGVSKADLNISAGEEIRFFLTPDALNMKGEGKELLADERASYVLRDADGNLATADSTGGLRLFHVNHANGKERLIKTDHDNAAFHSTSETGAMNPDQVILSETIIDPFTGTATISFEDSVDGGNGIFDDVVIQVDIGIANAQASAGGVVTTESTAADFGIDTTASSTGPNDDHLFGEAGNDTLYGWYGDDTLDGGADNDTLIGGSGNDTLLGGDGVDHLEGGEHNDQLFGGAGNDSLEGNSGEDFLDGGAGDDWLYSGSDNDVLVGGDGNDILIGGGADDILIAGLGDDTYHGGSGNDTIDFSNFNGVIVNLHSKFSTGAGNDTLLSLENVIATAGDDNIKGSSRDNVIDGGEGNDIIRGVTGNDTLTGGGGDDVFIWLSWDVSFRGASYSDVVTDFGAGDILNLAHILPNSLDDYSSWLQLNVVGADTEVQVDLGGAGTDYQTFVTLEDYQEADLSALFDQGAIIA